MEQNAMPGLTNRLLGRVVRRCFLSMDVRQGTLPAHKCEVVGNPVRRQMVEQASAAPFEAPDPEAFTVFITGGSGGAGALNKHLPVALRGLPEEVARKLVVVHQAGRGRDEPVRQAWRGFAGQVEVVEFVQDMGQMYRRADLVICRAGATTLAELFLLGQPALLIPFAGAADNHQEENARAVVEAGGALMVREAELSGGRVEKLLVGLMQNPEALENLSRAAGGLGRPEAGAEVARRLLAMVQEAR
jgi:UDP-N-acetylglucosamine--N-acetylmuramyl-(pentapeptide) pyrophosphoryl-undecaprenol N-acetylglucosamine transferase